MQKYLVELLEARGISAETQQRFGVTASEKHGSDWIKIPYLVNGEVVNHKYRTIHGEKKFCQDEKSKKCFWNYDVIKSVQGEPLIITEGELDAMIAIQCGYSRVVSVPDGAPPEPNAGDVKYSYLVETLGLLRKETEIILAVDSDSVGNNLLHDLSERLGKQRCKFVKYPKGCKDLNDAFSMYGERAVIETINRAQWFKIGGLYSPKELPPMPEKKLYSTGFPGMDKHYNIRLGDFTVVSGVPGHGKSTWVNDLCCRVAKKHGWLTAFASFEQNPSSDHMKNLRQWYIGKPKEEQTEEEKAEAEDWINKHFCFIVPEVDDNGEEPDIDLKWVLEKSSAAVIQKGAKIVVIDPWNEMDHIRPPGVSLTEYVGIAIKQFKKFARERNIHLIIVAHPTKEIKEKDGTARMPTLYDISDSSNWYNKCDVGIVVHRGVPVTKLTGVLAQYDPYELSIVRVCKSRYHDEIGVPGEMIALFTQSAKKYNFL